MEPESSDPVHPMLVAAKCEQRTRQFFQAP